MEGIHSCNPSPFFLLHFAVGVVHYFLSPEGGLDGLKGMGDAIKKKFKKIKNKKKLTIAKSLFSLRKTSCCLINLKSAMSLDSNRDCSTTSATYLAIPC